MRFWNLTSNLLCIFQVSFPSVLPVNFPKVQSLHNIHAHHLFLFFFILLAMCDHTKCYTTVQVDEMWVFIYMIFPMNLVILMARVTLVFEGRFWINRFGFIHILLHNAEIYILFPQWHWMDIVCLKKKKKKEYSLSLLKILWGREGVQE